jgi:heat shock protein HslJ
MFNGDYKIVEVLDAEGNSINIPSEGSDRFNLHMESTTGNAYQFGLQVGNSLGGRMTIDGEQVTIGQMRSTMMMPPPEVYKLEMALSSMFPKMTSISLVDGTLTLEGSGGKAVFQKS